jgi:hypothetical protein
MWRICRAAWPPATRGSATSADPPARRRYRHPTQRRRDGRRRPARPIRPGRSALPGFGQLRTLYRSIRRGSAVTQAMRPLIASGRPSNRWVGLCHRGRSCGSDPGIDTPSVRKPFLKVFCIGVRHLCGHPVPIPRPRRDQSPAKRLRSKAASSRARSRQPTIASARSMIGGDSPA